MELPRRGGSDEYPQSMFLSRNKKNNVYPCKAEFYFIKVGFKGGMLCIRDENGLVKEKYKVKNKTHTRTTPLVSPGLMVIFHRKQA